MSDSVLFCDNLRVPRVCVLVVGVLRAAWKKAGFPEMRHVLIMFFLIVIIGIAVIIPVYIDGVNQSEGGEVLYDVAPWPSALVIGIGGLIILLMTYFCGGYRDA